EKLYKYYSLSERTIKSFDDNTVYFSHGHLLNDIMDGNFMLWDLSRFILKFRDETNDRTTTAESLLSQITKPFLEKRDVLSLCITYQNELIWAHYTGETGYCIELNTDRLKENLLENRSPQDLLFFPVSYGKLQQIDFSK